MLLPQYNSIRFTNLLSPRRLRVTHRTGKKRFGLGIGQRLKLRCAGFIMTCSCALSRPASLNRTIRDLTQAGVAP